MKIVLTTHQFFPFSSGGTEVVVHQAAKELQRRGHQITLVTAQPCPDDMPYQNRFDTYTYDGLHIERFHHNYTALQGQTLNTEIEYNNRFFYHRFKKFLHDLRPDLVHCFHLHRLSASAVDAITELAIPAFFTATDFWPICPTSQLLLPDNSLCEGPTKNAANCIRHLTRNHPHGEKFQSQSDSRIALTVTSRRLGLFRNHWYTPHMLAAAARLTFVLDRINRFQKVLCPSQTLCDLLIRNGVHKHLAIHHANGVNTSRISRALNKGSGPALRVGFLGQVAEHKGAAVLVEAFRQLTPAAKAELHIHGVAELQSPFYQHLLARAAPDPRIIFHGPYQNAQISDVLASLDILVVPSIWYENTPQVIYEALAAGVPPLVSNLGGLAEAVKSGHDGLTFEKGNPADLAAKISQLIADRPLVARLAANTQPPKTVHTYVDELETLYAARSR